MAGHVTQTHTHSFRLDFSFVWIFHYLSLSLMRRLVLIAALRSGKSNEIFIGLKVRGDALIQFSIYWDSGKHQRSATSSFPWDNYFRSFMHFYLCMHFLYLCAFLRIAPLCCYVDSKQNSSGKSTCPAVWYARLHPNIFLYLFLRITMHSSTIKIYYACNLQSGQ